MGASSYLSFLFVSQLVLYSTGFFFELSEKAQLERCFQEEYDEGLTIAGTYKIRDYFDGTQEHEPGAIHLRISDPDGQDMLQRQYKDTGSFAFAAGSFGVYEICFMKLPSEVPKTTRVYLHYEIKEGDRLSDNDVDDEVASNSTALEKLIKRIDDDYETVLTMYHKFKKREKKFRDVSATTNSRIIWWAVFQVTVLVITAAWQMRHLTRFFVLKKIV